MTIKICGITRLQDARAAVAAGANAVGLVFARSPRRVSPALARRIVASLPPFVTPVGVFVNASAATILRIAGAVGFTVVQLHGDEDCAIIPALAPLRVIKVVRVRDRSFQAEFRACSAAFGVRRPAALLLDAYSPTARGGTGRPLDWNLLVSARRAGWLDGALPLILAGGLTAANVARAIRLVRPDAVDVSGGVESAPGIKDPARIRRFCLAARSVRWPLSPPVVRARSYPR